jgi:hypothetical protein
MSSAASARNPLDFPLPAAKPKPLRVTAIGQKVTPAARPLDLPAPMTPLVRMKELEELAQLACDENDKLKREVDGLREENEILLRRISVLEVSPVAPEAALPVASLPALGGADVDEVLGASLGELEAPFRLTPTQDLKRRSARLQSFCALCIALLLVGSTAVVGLFVLGARTEMRWARTGFAPGQLLAGVEVVHTTVAPLFAAHPRYGR